MTASAATSASRSRLPSKRTLYFLFLLFLFVVYWIFVWRMERIALTPADLPLAVLQGLPPWIVNFMGIFLPRVLRHFIPLILGWLIAYEIAANLVLHLYDLPDRARARSFLRRLRDPRRAGGSMLSVTPQELEVMRGASARLRVGGPGRIAIPTGHAAVTELNGRYYRVIGSGGHALDRFEYLHSLYDLRPQDRTDGEVVLHSREGLEFETSVSVTFRIDAPDMVISAQQAYPFDVDTLRELAYRQVNLPGERTSDWEDASLATVKNILAATVSTFSLNELLQDEQTEMGSHLTIRRNVEREARAKLREQGIDLIRVRIGGFRFSEEVTDLHISFWRAYWDRQSQQSLPEDQALTADDLQRADLEAELALVRAITQGMEEARRQGSAGSMSDVVALGFVDTLEKMALQSQSELTLPADLLPQLHDLQDKLRIANGQASAAGGE